MTLSENIAAIEDRVSACGSSIKALCGSAGISQSTWTRWKAGVTVPNMATWSRITAALIVIETRSAAQPQERAR